jgi:glycerol-3-phosphate O-acyltransferase
MELSEQLALALDMLRDCDYSERVTFTEKLPGEIIAYGVELGVIEVRPHPLGDIVVIVAEQSVLLTYFSNNISHLVALPSLVSSCFLNARRMGIDHLKRIALRLYPFLKTELFLPWDETEFLAAVDRHLEWLQSRGLLRKASDEGTLMRPRAGSPEDWKLRVTAHTLLQTFERYYITIAILAKNGSGKLTRNELERLCILTAQRISELNEFAAPEFYDRNLFRQFIGQLRETGVLTVNEQAKLEFNEVIRQISEDARYVLSEEIRHGIMRVAPQVLAQTADDAGTEKRT